MPFFGKPSTEAQVRKLKESVLFSAGFPKRVRFSHEQWAVMSDAERRASTSACGTAIRLVKNHAELTELVKQLGDPKHAAAVPVLAQIWSDCAVSPIRTAAGHALLKIGTREALAALQGMIGDADHFSVFFGVRAMFDESGADSFNRCAAYFEPEQLKQPGGTVIPHAILNFFAPSGLLGGKTPQWTDDRAPDWFKNDPRWLDLCVRLRKDKELGRTARYVLRYADAQPVAAALDKERASEVPRVLRITTVAMGDLLARYQRGEHEDVWKELRSHESLDGDFLQEATAVAMETMKRVAHAADLVAERLASRGWEAAYESLRTHPREEDERILRDIEAAMGARLPVSLRAFWKVVGGINFVWNYDSNEEVPDLGLGVNLEMPEMDPLCVHSLDIVQGELADWQDMGSGIDPDLVDPIEISIAPDYLHKVNVSGGAPYSIQLPFLGADPVVANEAHNLPFVDYLRLCFRWGGFPDLERHHDREDVKEFVRWMTEGMERF